MDAIRRKAGEGNAPASPAAAAPAREFGALKDAAGPVAALPATLPAIEKRRLEYLLVECLGPWGRKASADVDGVMRRKYGAVNGIHDDGTVSPQRQDAQRHAKVALILLKPAHMAEWANRVLEAAGYPESQRYGAGHFQAVAGYLPAEFAEEHVAQFARSRNMPAAERLTFRDIGQLSREMRSEICKGIRPAFEACIRELNGLKDKVQAG